MRIGLAIVAALAALSGASGAEAQAYQCSIPGVLTRPHPDLPSAKEPARRLPIGGYTLAVSWSPEYCHGHARESSAKFECGSGNRFGFTLHGLWPDGIGKDWPQYCTSTELLPTGFIAGRLCTTPSAQLIQHEWAKHGTCSGLSATAYFDRSTQLYARLHYPDMAMLAARRGLTAGAFATAMARANPGLAAAAIRVTANKAWLDELWLCLGRDMTYGRCRPNAGGLAAGATLKIARLPR